jgi:hypothetical protein
VIACENKTNFLALPQLERTLALWGAGGAATGHFPHLGWLRDAAFVYWGDLDPSGFAILASLRGHFPHVRSAMMDVATLEAHREAIGVAKPSRHPVPLDRLIPVESAALAAITSPPKGIEQEKLLFATGSEPSSRHSSMGNITNPQSYSARERLSFLERLAYWRGWVRRSDLVERFGVSVPQASADIAAYNKSNPRALRYDSSAKRYEGAPNMQCVLGAPDLGDGLTLFHGFTDRVTVAHIDLPTRYRTGANPT